MTNKTTTATKGESTPPTTTDGESSAPTDPVKDAEDALAAFKATPDTEHANVREHRRALAVERHGLAHYDAKLGTMRKPVPPELLTPKKG